MMLTRDRSNRRRGVTAVEMAFVLIPLIMVFMGIFEYGRLLMDWNLLINAAQVGCRFALANNQDPTLSTEVQAIATNQMGSSLTSFSNFTVTVAGTHQGVSTSVNNLFPGDPITVTVTGNYQLMNIIPLVSMPSVLSLSSSSTMICEGGI